MKKTNTTAKLLQLYSDKAVNRVLTNRYDKASSEFLRQLNSNRKSDFYKLGTASDERIDALTKQANAIEEKLEPLRKDRAYYYSQAHRLTISQAERDAFFVKYETVRKTIAELVKIEKSITAELDGYYNAHCEVVSDRADLVQSAVEGMLLYLNGQLEGKYYSNELLDEERELTAEELGIEVDDINTANLDEADLQQLQAVIPNFDIRLYRVACLFASRAIRQLTHIDALNGYKSVLTRATDNDVINWITLHNLAPMDEPNILDWAKSKEGQITLRAFKRPLPRRNTSVSELYETLEFKEYKRQEKKTAFYFIKHYRYIAPYRYILDNDNEVVTKAYDPFTHTLTDYQRLATLGERYNLTEREQVFICEFMRACKPSENNKELYINARKTAFAKIGILTESTQRSFIKRLRDRIKAQTQTENEPDRKTEKSRKAKNRKPLTLDIKPQPNKVADHTPRIDRGIAPCKPRQIMYKGKIYTPQELTAKARYIADRRKRRSEWYSHHDNDGTITSLRQWYRLKY